MDYNPRHWRIPSQEYIPDITERHDYHDIEDEYLDMDGYEEDFLIDDYIDEF